MNLPRLIRHTIASAAVLLLPLLLLGCGSEESETVDAAEPVSFTLINQTGEPIREVSITGVKFNGSPAPLAYGTVDVGAAETLSDRRMDMPSSVTIDYTPARDSRTSATASLPSQPGPVTLTLRGPGDVRVSR